MCVCVCECVCVYYESMQCILTIYAMYIFTPVQIRSAHRQVCKDLVHYFLLLCISDLAWHISIIWCTSDAILKVYASLYVHTRTCTCTQIQLCRYCKLYTYVYNFLCYSLYTNTYASYNRIACTHTHCYYYVVCIHTISIFIIYHTHTTPPPPPPPPLPSSHTHTHTL